MRPPWVSTIPLQMARPKPVPTVPFPGSSAPGRENLRNRCGSRSAGMPASSSETEISTWTPLGAASTRMGYPAGECRAALDSRLPMTCTMRRRSAITRGRSGGRSSRMSCRAPPLRKVFLARSTSTATSEDPGEIDRVPASVKGGGKVDHVGGSAG